MVLLPLLFLLTPALATQREQTVIDGDVYVFPSTSGNSALTSNSVSFSAISTLGDQSSGATTSLDPSRSGPNERVSRSNISSISRIGSHFINAMTYLQCGELESGGHSAPH